MRIIIGLLILLCFELNAKASEELFDNPIEFTKDHACSINEYCDKFIQDIDIEKFIKQELKNNYIVVSLDECIDIALKNNFDIRINEYKYKSANYEYKNSLSKFLPILTTKSYIAQYQGPILVGGVLNDKFHETAISVNITAQHNLTEGGKDIFSAKSKSHFKKSKKHDLKYSKRETIYQTSKAYYELLLAKMHIAIYLRNLIERNAQLQLTKNLASAGLGTKFDVIRSKSESEYAKARLLSALYSFKAAQTKISNIMGIDLNSAIMPFENEVKKLDLIDESKTEINTLYKLAINNREDLSSYKELINQQIQEKNVILTEYIPKPYISYQQQFQGTQKISVRPNYILGAYLDWNPGENMFFGTFTKYKAKKEEIKSMKLELENKLRNIEETLTNNYAASGFARRAIIITKDRVDYAKESIKLAILRFNYGKGILLDVIQAQSQLTQARVEYVETIIQYNIAQIGLIFNSGQMTKEIILENYKP